MSKRSGIGQETGPSSDAGGLSDDAATRWPRTQVVCMALEPLERGNELIVPGELVSLDEPTAHALLEAGRVRLAYEVGADG